PAWLSRYHHAARMSSTGRPTTRRRGSGISFSRSGRVGAVAAAPARASARSYRAAPSRFSESATAGRRATEGEWPATAAAPSLMAWTRFRCATSSGGAGQGGGGSVPWNRSATARTIARASASATSARSATSCAVRVGPTCESHSALFIGAALYPGSWSDGREDDVVVHEQDDVIRVQRLGGERGTVASFDRQRRVHTERRGQGESLLRLAVEAEPDLVRDAPLIRFEVVPGARGDRDA